MSLTQADRTPISNTYQFPTSKPVNTTPSINNIDQLYFQNLVTAIYTIANYQQQQQQHNLTNINQNRPGLVAGMPGLNLNNPMLNLTNFNGNTSSQINNINANFNTANVNNSNITNNNNINKNSAEIPNAVHKDKIKPIAITPVNLKKIFLQTHLPVFITKACF